MGYVDAEEEKACGAQNVVMLKQFFDKMFDDADEWIRPWMSIDKDNLKQIGARQLDIIFDMTCDVWESCDYIYDSWANSQLSSRSGGKTVDKLIETKARQRLDRAESIWRAIGKEWVVKKTLKRKDYITETGDRSYKLCHLV